MNTDFVAIVLFFCLAGVSISAMFLAYRAKKEQQITLRHAMDSGATLDPAMIASLGNPARTPEMDLRSGVIMVCLAIGLGICTTVLWATQFDSELVGIFGIIATIIGSLGAGNLISWKLRANKSMSPDA